MDAGVPLVHSFNVWKYHLVQFLQNTSKYASKWTPCRAEVVNVCKSMASIRAEKVEMERKKRNAADPVSVSDACTQPLAESLEISKCDLGASKEAYRNGVHTIIMWSFLRYRKKYKRVPKLQSHCIGGVYIQLLLQVICELGPDTSYKQMASRCRCTKRLRHIHRNLFCLSHLTLAYAKNKCKFT